MTHSDERAEHATPHNGQRQTHNAMNGAVEGPVIQRGNLDDAGTDTAGLAPEADTDVSTGAPTVRNSVTGSVTGAVVQTGNVYGGLTIT